MSDSLTGFVDFFTIKDFPLLHLPRIKIKIAGNRSTDPHIISTKLFMDRFLVTLDATNTLRYWNLKTGKYI